MNKKIYFFPKSAPLRPPAPPPAAAGAAGVVATPLPMYQSKLHSKVKKNNRSKRLTFVQAHCKQLNVEVHKCRLTTV